MRHNLNLALRPHLTHLNRISQVAGSVVDFDFLLQEAGECCGVEDFVRGGLGGIYGVLGF